MTRKTIDIQLRGSAQIGFWTFSAISDKGLEWMYLNFGDEEMLGCETYSSVVPCDDTRMALEIYEGMCDDGLHVHIV